jgi:hypothetical protein
MSDSDHIEALATSSPVENQWPIAPEKPLLVMPGTYRAFCLSYEFFCHYRFEDRKKLHLKMQVFFKESDPENSIVLPRYFNHYDRPGTGTDYYKEWLIANYGNPPKRNDRMSPKKFVGKVYKVRVRTVKKDKDGDDYHKNLQHSVVGKILSLER